MATGDHPFYNNNRKTIVNNILKKKLTLPSWLPAGTHSLLKGLLMRDPVKRLGHAGGASEVKKHPFFKALKFEDLLAKRVTAPLRSHAKTGSEFDVTAHSERYTTAARELSPVASPDVLSTSKQALFHGFSWSNSIHSPGGVGVFHLGSHSPKLPEGWQVQHCEGSVGSCSSGAPPGDDEVMATHSLPDSCCVDVPSDAEGGTPGGGLPAGRSASISVPIPVGKSSSMPVAIRGF